MTDQTTTTPEVIDVPELIEAQTAKSIREHITTMHNSDTYNLSDSLPYGVGFTKAGKPDLLHLHERLHTEDHFKQRMSDGTMFFQRIEHEHGGVAVDAEDKAEPGTTPRLTPAERRTLERLVDMDFDSVQTEVQQYAADKLSERLAGLDEEFKGQVAKAERFAQQYREEVLKGQQRLQAIVDKAKDDGLNFNGNPGSAAATFTIVDRDAKRRAIELEVNQQRDRALRTLMRKRLGTQRTVLLTGLGGNVEQVLQSIPSATEVMSAALAESATVTAITSS